MSELNKISGVVGESKLGAKLKKLKAHAKRHKLKDWAFDIVELQALRPVNPKRKKLEKTFKVTMSWQKD